jgi:hypothetical protein
MPHERLPQIFLPGDAPLEVTDDVAKISLELTQALWARLN